LISWSSTWPTLLSEPAESIKSLVGSLLLGGGRDCLAAQQTPAARFSRRSLQAAHLGRVESGATARW
jgi:hypothetical protein